MLNNKDYCDNQTSDELENLGYPRYHYDATEIDKIFRIIPLYAAQKWLREEKGIHIEIYACAGGYIYELCKAYKPNSFSGGTTIYTPNDVDNPKLNDAGRYETYEETLSEGLRTCIKILQDEQKENN